MLNEDREYSFTEICLEGEWINAVKILDGPYKNVVYYYGHVKVVPDKDQFRLAYQYTIWDTAGLVKEQLIQSIEFHNFIGDVLVSIISDESGKGEYATPGKHYSEESDL